MEQEFRNKDAPPKGSPKVRIKAGRIKNIMPDRKTSGRA
jgi:hypothetical protein